MDRLDRQTARAEEVAAQRKKKKKEKNAYQKASHSSGNVEMVKAIGMRVGGPSESKVRGMRSEREMGKEVLGRDSTFNEEEKSHNKKKKRK